MNGTRIITIVCWLVVAIVLIGLAIWFITGNLFGFRTGINFHMPIFNIGSVEDLSGPFNEAGTYTIEDDVDSIHVDWVAGEVRVTPYDGSEIIITEYARRSLRDNEKLSYDVSGGTLKIRYVDTAFSFTMLTKKIEILVPESLAKEMNALYVGSTSADMTINGFSTETLEITETSGTANISDIRAEHASAHSVSGEINITSLNTSRLTVGSVSGGIRFTDVTANTVESGTTSGDQHFEGTFKSVDADSVSGGITIVSTVDPESISCDTTSGDIRLTIPGKDDIVVSYSTVSGDFSSQVPVITGGGQETYNFHTVSGDMQIIALETQNGAA